MLGCHQAHFRKHADKSGVTFNRCGHGLSATQMQEVEAGMAQQLTAQSDLRLVFLPATALHFYVIDRLETKLGLQIYYKCFMLQGQTHWD